MTYTNFKDLVASYSNRLGALFASVGAQDVVLAAMNDARRDAQRRYVFNHTRRQAFVQLSLAPASFLTDFDADPTGAGAAVVVRRLESLWEYGSTTVGATTRYYPTNPVPIRSMATFGQVLPVRQWPLSASYGQTTLTTVNFAYIQGTNVLHSTLSTPAWFLADVYAFLADHDGGASEDWFLTYGLDWLKFATLTNLNTWLKDGEQIAVNAQAMQAAWNSMTNFDAQQTQGGPINLD